MPDTALPCAPALPRQARAAHPSREHGPAPRLRLLPVPPSEPPYDDEPGARPHLRLVPPLPPSPAAAPSPSPAPVVARRALPRPLRDERPARTPTSELPDARRFAAALVQRLVEVRSGLRPVPQLQRDTAPGLYADLERVLVRRPRPGAAPARGAGPDVHSVHVQTRPDGVAEVCATVRRGDRLGALALRLEGVAGRWLCTSVTGL